MYTIDSAVLVPDYSALFTNVHVNVLGLCMCVCICMVLYTLTLGVSVCVCVCVCTHEYLHGLLASLVCVCVFAWSCTLWSLCVCMHECLHGLLHVASLHERACLLSMFQGRLRLPIIALSECLYCG